MRARDQRLIGFARGMRHEPTLAEQAVWRLLRGRRFRGLKFRRQAPVGPYIADFACIEAKLIVECDGGQHGGERDARRDVFLAEQGFRVVRLWNSDVLDHGDEGAFDALENMIGPA